jgi:uncharacterized protein (TIGR02452 family)
MTYSTIFYRMDRKVRRDIYRDTQEKIRKGKFHKLIHGPSKKLTTDSLKINDINKNYQTTIDVVKEDVLVVSERMFKIDKNICVLSMGSYLRPGGGVEEGSLAQEEEIFRRTNISLSLNQYFYPLKNSEVIYTEHIHVVKDCEYKDISKPFKISVITAAALKYPDREVINGIDVYSDPKDYDLMDKTIENIFKTAIMNQHTTLILGALGCGAYSNPQCQVINMFNRCTQKYKGYFKNIIFAVYSQRDKNFDIFNEGIVR